MTTVHTHLEEVEETLIKACERSSRKREEITVIGVTKYVTIERTKELLDAGIMDLGENRAEELQHKYEEIEDEATWHFIGTLQSRKVKDVIDKVTSIHSLDRLSVAKQINKRVEKPMDCFIQVNISGEETKHGLNKEAVLPFIESLSDYSNVRIKGLMTMAPHVDDEEQIRNVFRQLRELRDEIQAKNFDHAPCHDLSMGMSNDYEIAIEEGATHIRLGSVLVGNS